LNQDIKKSIENKRITRQTVKTLILVLIGTLPLAIRLSLDVEITTNCVRNLERQSQYEELENGQYVHDSSY
jgi:hypothetical protein